MSPYLEDDPSQDTAVERQRRRWAITGRPQFGKTTSLLTFQRPCAIVSCPDELGFGSLPKHLHPTGGCTPDCPRWQLDVFIFGAMNVEKPDWIGTCEETRRMMADLLTGKKGWTPPGAQSALPLAVDPRSQVHESHGIGESGGGPGKVSSIRYRTVALDGWHKLYNVYLNMFSGGRFSKGEDFMGKRIYPQTKEVFFSDLRRWCQTDVEWFVVTMWVDRDQDDPNVPESASHFFPALSGKAGQHAVGEIGITVAAERQGTGPAAKYIWLTQPDNRYWGIGCHLPPDLAKKLPVSVAQDWKALVPYLGLEAVKT